MNEEKYIEMLEDGTLYDFITNLQEENEKLKKDLKTLWNVCWNNDTEMTSYQNEIFDNYYDMFHKNGGVE